MFHTFVHTHTRQSSLFVQMLTKPCRWEASLQRLKAACFFQSLLSTAVKKSTRKAPQNFKFQPLRPAQDHCNAHHLVSDQLEQQVVYGRMCVWRYEDPQAAQEQYPDHCDDRRRLAAARHAWKIKRASYLTASFAVDRKGYAMKRHVPSRDLHAKAFFCNDSGFSTLRQGAKPALTNPIAPKPGVTLSVVGATRP